jgi:hypothetical protein
MALSFGKPKSAWGVPLTSQEKKVLGFVLFLAALGLVMLGWKGWRERQSQAAPATVPAEASSKDKRFR